MTVFGDRTAVTRSYRQLTRPTVVDQYLGIWIKTIGLTQFALQKRAELGNSRAKFTFFNSLKSYQFDPNLAFRLLDTLAAVLFYGVKVLGYFPFGCHIETVQTVHRSYANTQSIVEQICELLCMVNQEVCLYITLALCECYDSGQNSFLSPITFLTLMCLSCIKLSLNIVLVPAHFLRSFAYKHGRTFRLPIYTKFYCILLYDQRSTFEKYINHWFTEILSYTSLKNFRRFKTSHGLEKYLTVVKDLKHWTASVRLRLRSHNLAIEIGRHKNLPHEHRFVSELQCRPNRR